ncbi:MAG: VWA-like domain-containing protein [Candidatus Bathyarchaeia archaeon]
MYVLIVKPAPLDPVQVERVKKRLEWALTFLIVRYGFVHQILAMMTKTPSNLIGTMGVRVLNGGKFELLYNPVFVDHLKDEELVYVFYHEILHLALHHCTSRKFDDHELGGIATDLAVNELIPINPGSCEPPRDKNGELAGVFVSEFRKIYKDIKEKQTSEWYYDFLKNKQSKENQSKGKNKFDNHDGWKEDEVADERIRAKIKEIDQSDLWGDVQGTNREIILAAQARKINWRNHVRRFLGNHSWKDREATRKRPNRRMGYEFAGNRRLYVDRHLVAVDTSGSIDSELLSQFLSIVNSMLDYMPIDLMQFDAEKTAGPIPFDRRRVQYEFTGRGGTCFEPVMKTVRDKHYKSVTIITDGIADVCSKPNADVLWVLPKGCNPPVDWGKRVYMERHV